jgi:hypothetical protein
MRGRNELRPYICCVAVLVLAGLRGAGRGEAHGQEPAGLAGDLLGAQERTSVAGKLAGDRADRRRDELRVDGRWAINPIV